VGAVVGFAAVAAMANELGAFEDGEVFGDGWLGDSGVKGEGVDGGYDVWAGGGVAVAEEMEEVGVGHEVCAVRRCSHCTVLDGRGGSCARLATSGGHVFRTSFLDVFLGAHRFRKHDLQYGWRVLKA